MCLRRKNITTEDENCFDPSCFGDAVAMRTQWVPMCAGGTNFDTHELILISNYRIEFRILTITYISFALVFVLMIASVVSTVNTGNADVWFFISPIIFILFFFRHYNRSVFDKSKMLFWKGASEYDFYVDSRFEKNAKFDDIHAVQLLYKILDDIDGEGEDDIYELNIVLNDSRRIYVVSYANKNKIRQDAAILSKFLNKPLWDAIDLQAM